VDMDALRSNSIKVIVVSLAGYGLAILVCWWLPILGIACCASVPVYFLMSSPTLLASPAAVQQESGE
jgi:hypothetical protein